MNTYSLNLGSASVTIYDATDEGAQRRAQRVARALRMPVVVERHGDASTRVHLSHMPVARGVTLTEDEAAYVAKKWSERQS